MEAPNRIRQEIVFERKEIQKKKKIGFKVECEFIPTGSPRPFGPGLPDGPSGYGITGMNMYNTLGGNDFYSRVNQTGKDDLSHCRLPFSLPAKQTMLRCFHKPTRTIINTITLTSPLCHHHDLCIDVVKNEIPWRQKSLF